MKRYVQFLRLTPDLWRVMVPNAITSLSAFFGLLAINAAVVGYFEGAVILVLAAAVGDCLDGYAARLVKGASRFGAELDSLADFLNFGAAPGIIVYFWSLDKLPQIGFTVSAAYVLCCAYRLARFNVRTLDSTDKGRRAGYFEGVPAPAGAACALFPLFLAFWSESTWPQSWPFCAATLLVTALAMVATFPTFSSKSLLRPANFKALATGMVLFSVVALFEPWGALTLLVLAYIGSVPIAWITAKAVGT